MRRITPALSFVLTLAVATTFTLVPGGGPAAGSMSAPAAPQCQGETATIVGSPDMPIIVGTDQDDVIISNGSDVEAGGGDDRICLTEDSASVKAGTGDDAVTLAPGAKTRSTSIGGRGRDTITMVRSGAVARSAVFGSTRLHSFRVDEETDSLFFGFENLGATNFARIDLEAGTTYTLMTAIGCYGHLEGSSRDDVLRVVRAPRCPASVASEAFSVRGGYGDDVMIGSSRGDLLRGGAGRDVARGGPGVDRCGAEVRRGCEH